MIEIRRTNNHWRKHDCEYVDQHEVVFSSYGVLKFCLNDKDLSLLSISKIIPLYKRLLLRIPLLSRLLRWQFYNVMKCNNGWFVSWAKNLYWIDSNKQCLDISIIDREFRVFRNGLASLGDKIYFGEYINNSTRDCVNLYEFDSESLSSRVIKEFGVGEIRHIHAVRKSADDKLLIFTGDIKDECRIIKFDPISRETISTIKGTEDFRAIYGYENSDGTLVYGTDAQYQRNAIFELQEKQLNKIREISGPVFYGCKVGQYIIMSIVYEGAPAQQSKNAELLILDINTIETEIILTAEKDSFNTRYFQFGQILLPNISGDVEQIWVSGIGLRKFNGLYEIEVRL